MKYNPLGLLFWAGVYAIAWWKTPRLSEHDRFADRAIYSEDPALDPLANHKETPS